MHFPCSITHLAPVAHAALAAGVDGRTVFIRGTITIRPSLDFVKGIWRRIVPDAKVLHDLHIERNQAASAIAVSS